MTLGKALPFSGSSLFHLHREAAGLSSQLQYCGPQTPQSRERVVSYHHACSGRLKSLTPQGQLKSPLLAMFLEEALWKRACTYSMRQVIRPQRLSSFCQLSVRMFWRKKPGEMWRLVQDILPHLTSAPAPNTHSGTHQHLLSLPRKWFKGTAKVCWAEPLSPEGQD